MEQFRSKLMFQNHDFFPPFKLHKSFFLIKPCITHNTNLGDSQNQLKYQKWGQ